MAEPFDALRTPLEPARPDPEFARRLRERIQHALELPKGVIVSDLSTDTLTEIRDESRRTQASEPPPAAVPYLAVRGAERALEWYAATFGARVVGEPIVMPDGRIGHAELAFPTGRLFLSEEHPELGVVAPTPGAVAVSLVIDVDDADAVLARAVEAGARPDREPYEGYGHRNAWMVDPFGHRWLLQGPVPGASPPQQPVAAEPIRHGDIGYVSVQAPDVARAATFYSAVLGWEYAPSEPGSPSRRVTNAGPSIGLYGTPVRPSLFCAFAVDDTDEAVRRIREAGGRSGEPEDRPYGRLADCVDNQGVAFAVYQPRPDNARPAPNGTRPGDLAYVTFEVADSERTRAFYGQVLGWRYSPGSVADGWQVDGVTPMAGLSGGHDQPVTVPMWRVDDIEAAVAAVREAGGRAGEVRRAAYGLTCECTDDQGGRFYLGQL